MISDFSILSDSNLLFYAMKHYDNPACSSMEEFEADLQIPHYIKRLIAKYRRDGELRERLILNHIISFTNVFGPKCAVRLLFYKLDEKDYPVLIPFLSFLSICPEIIYGIPETVILSGIETDKNVTKVLENMWKNSGGIEQS